MLAILLVSALVTAFLKAAGNAGFGVSMFLETLQAFMITDKVSQLSIFFICCCIDVTIIPVLTV